MHAVFIPYPPLFLVVAQCLWYIQYSEVSTLSGTSSLPGTSPDSPLAYLFDLFNSGAFILPQTRPCGRFSHVTKLDSNLRWFSLEHSFCMWSLGIYLSEEFISRIFISYQLHLILPPQLTSICSPRNQVYSEILQLSWSNANILM